MVTYQEWKTEQESWQRLKGEVDLLSREIVGGRIEDEAVLERRIQEVRELCGRLFPDKLELFDLIYRPRFQRLMDHSKENPESGR
jgi:hypothetical protein